MPSAQGVTGSPVLETASLYAHNASYGFNFPVPCCFDLLNYVFNTFSRSWLGTVTDCLLQVLLGSGFRGTCCHPQSLFGRVEQRGLSKLGHPSFVLLLHLLQIRLHI